MTGKTKTLDEEIDTLAIDIEKQIASQKETLENTPEFDSKYRRMEEADPTELL